MTTAILWRALCLLTAITVEVRVACTEGVITLIAGIGPCPAQDKGLLSSSKKAIEPQSPARPNFFAF